jgi:DNA ligase (NAD+)
VDYILKSKELLNKELDSFNKIDVLLLSDIISYHSDLYYNKEEPVVSDYEYDELFKKLEILEDKF